ncbi:hypothetical protein QL285_083473 [Trifolium repens]|nr:hypothetical protein QL285_083473 [Trifolium repens]
MIWKLNFFAKILKGLSCKVWVNVNFRSPFMEPFNKPKREFKRKILFKPYKPGMVIGLIIQHIVPGIHIIKIRILLRREPPRETSCTRRMSLPI